EDILSAIEANKNSLAVVCLSGVQYYSGQYFDIATITTASRRAGAYSIWDLAHAVGNVDLALHEWGVDGAAWCSYKYLNSGAGGVGGLFLHQRHHHRNSGPEKQPYLKGESKLNASAFLSGFMLAGWWGHLESTRFEMTNEWEPETGAAAMRLSNVPMLAAAAMMGSLGVFNKTSMTQLRTKSILLTGLLQREVNKLTGKGAEMIFRIITPFDPRERGAQLSLKFEV
ncbi:Kynureninase, putative, partial [Perkinsus marinus ATCC 50983]